MTLADELARAVVVLDSPDVSIGEVLRSLVTPIPEPVARGALLEDLLFRHRILPCAIGNGVAFPQTVAYEYAESAVSIIRTRRGIEFGASDRVPVRLFFGLFGPGWMKVTAYVSRALKSPGVLDELLEQPTPEGFVRVLIDTDQRIRASTQTKG